jgi:hypothetical protein
MARSISSLQLITEREELSPIISGEPGFTSIILMKTMCFEPQNRRTRNPGPDLIHLDLAIGGQTWYSKTFNYSSKGVAPGRAAECRSEKYCLIL